MTSMDNVDLGFLVQCAAIFCGPDGTAHRMGLVVSEMTEEHEVCVTLHPWASGKSQLVHVHLWLLLVAHQKLAQETGVCSPYSDVPFAAKIQERHDALLAERARRGAIWDV